MGWNDLGASAPKGGDSLPILKIEAGKATRIRLIDGGGKYAEPAKRFQHWSDDANIKAPIACIGPRAGCIFHTEPMAWRVTASFCMNVIAYTIDPKTKEVTDRKILAFPAGQQIYGGIKDYADLTGTDPMAVDWIIMRSGTGKQDTKYTVAPAPGAPIDGAVLDLEQFPSQQQYGEAAKPQLVDFDQFDGYRKRTPEEQGEWLQKMLTVESQAALPAAATPARLGAGVQVQLPAARPADTIDAEYTVTSDNTQGTTAISKPKISLTPPPKPGATPPPKPPSGVQLFGGMKDPWGEKTMGDLTKDDLQYIVDTLGFSAEHINAAKALLGGAPGAAAPALANGSTPSNEDLRKELHQFLSTLPSIKEFQNARKFMALGGAASTQAMNADGLKKLISLARLGDAAVASAIAQANG